MLCLRLSGLLAAQRRPAALLDLAETRMTTARHLHSNKRLIRESKQDSLSRQKDGGQESSNKSQEDKTNNSKSGSGNGNGESRSERWKRIVAENAVGPLWTFTWILCALHVGEKFYTLHWLEGPSMMPTFNPSGDLTLVEHWTPTHCAIRRGDIVVAQSPAQPNKTVVKRVVGLPGDNICPDPSAAEAGAAMPLFKVPPGHYWLQGDNFRNSTDSRSYGPVPFGLIRGKVVSRVLPLDEAKWIADGVETVD